MKKVATIKEIAKALNISISTVSKALNDHPSIGTMTKDRVKAKAKELHYIPNQAARSFQQKKTNQIGLIVPSLRDQFYVECISGIEAEAIKHNYKVLLCQSHEDPQREVDLVNMMLLQRVDALIITTTKSTTNYDHIQELEQMGIPVLFFVRVPNDFPCHYIRNNAFDASQKATEYLIKKGHKNLAHIKGPVNLRTSRERAEGFQSALATHNIKINPAYIVTTDLSQAGNENAIKKLLSLAKKPTAVIAFNDLVALDAIEYIKKKDKTLLNQIEFSGFGNNRLLRYMDYPLTASVEEHPYNMGVEAIDILLQLIKADNEPSEYLQIVHSCELHTYR